MRFFSLLLFLFTLQVYSKNTTTINLSISNEGKFDVLYHRFESTATGAVFGGLIGGTIEEGVRKNKDNNKKKEILKLISNSSCKDRLISSLIEKLEDNTFEIVLEQETKKNKKSKFWLDVKILKCGLKMVNSTTKEISTFVEYNSIVREKNKIITKKKHSIVSKNQYNYLALSNDIKNLNSELDLVLKKAGKRLANKLIYQ